MVSGYLRSHRRGQSGRSPESCGWNLPKAQVLRDFPGIGYRYRIEAEGEIRILLYGHYRIAYLLRSPASIDILGVFQGALDIDRYFP